MNTDNTQEYKFDHVNDELYLFYDKEKYDILILDEHLKNISLNTGTGYTSFSITLGQPYYSSNVTSQLKTTSKPEINNAGDWELQ